MAFLLGIDVSTTATKAVLMDEQGEVAALAASRYSFLTPHEQWTEQEPGLWWNATITSVRRVLAESKIRPLEVAGIGLTGQMHGMTLLDASGEVIRPCILWNDQRTTAECGAITELVGANRVLELTGNPVLTGFTAPKILWVREHEPEHYARIAHVLLPKDYVRYKLTGEFLTDVSDASGTALFDVGRRCWSEEMLRALGLSREWFPEATESPTPSAKVNSVGARETGLLEGTPVVAGAGDQAAQAVGTGVVREGIVSVTIGTSGVVFAATDAYRVEPQGRLHAFCHAVPGEWHLMGVMLSAGGSFRWYRDTLGQPEKEIAQVTGQDVYDILTREAATAPAGSEGLLFLPYLSGERTPYPDPAARGVFFGLSLRHEKRHLTRAVLEGVSYGLRDSLELVRSLGLQVGQVRASGGGAQSELWRQILADVFDTTIVTVNATEGAAYGAAVLAGVGTGVYPTVPQACDAVLRVRDEHMPGPATETYARLYPRYRALYAALAPQFQAMALLKDEG